MENVHRRVYGKKRVKPGHGGGKLRDLYGQMFKTRNIMPDVLGRQNPTVFFKMLDSLNDEDEEYTGSDPYLKMFYGQ
ncbi:MAG: hypothetical protein LIO53_02190 [Oscillospiraceae bacterium]|nr:hypothetical protein [Oscillospiraceae bacterium]